MTISTDRAGVACCGNCGAHVVVACSAGCPEPDVQFRENYIAMLKKPAGFGARQMQFHIARHHSDPVRCTYLGCKEPRAACVPGARGRPTTRCVKHAEMARKYHKKVEAV